MGKTELAPGPLPDGFEPMSDKHIAKNRRVAVAIGENNVRRYTWKRASEEQNARGWASSMTMTMESMVAHNDADMVAGFVNVAAAVLTHALDSLRFERARAEAAEAEVERLRAVITKAVDDLPEWSAATLKYLSPAEVAADEVRMALRAAVTR